MWGPSVGLFLLWPGQSFLSWQILKESEVRLDGYTEGLVRVLPLGARVETAGLSPGMAVSPVAFPEEAPVLMGL